MIKTKPTVPFRLPPHYVYHPAAAAAASTYISTPSLLLPPNAPLMPSHFFADYGPPTAYPPPPFVPNSYDPGASPFSPYNTSMGHSPVAAAVAAAAAAAAGNVGAANSATHHHHPHHHPFAAHFAAAQNGPTLSNGYITGAITPTTVCSFIPTDGRLH